ncbi:65-kDa microtubule-associated protein 8-like [Phoenix dactylifera]|uniref:65-kDa microtubule-associated protein 8-like n=1 Tax=Phoenix dactylifera TaxID=42345 RepID=A0A8B8ZY78_PHODC|nr:65-kDa microtubule-associated protein 8-like [Phoenix dactylifera]
MGSFQMPANFPSSALPESSCAYLLQELKLIWDEVGQDQLERERVLLELEQECLEVYRRKVDSANISRVRLHQALADSEAELTNLLLSLGERSLPGRPEKLTGTLKEQLDSITPALREMQMRKEIRMNQFREVQTQIQRISSEIAGHSEYDSVVVNEGDLSLKKLEEYQHEFQRLHKEKNDRLRKVEEYINEVHQHAETMGMDSSKIITDVHPSLLHGSSGQQSKNISDTILDRLKSTVQQLKDEKQKRMEKLHRLGKALTNLWNLLDTPMEDQQPFSHIKFFSSSASVSYTLGPGSLTLDIIHQAESEVERLDQLKASKMKELFFKKQIELQGICKKSHMEVPPQSEMENIMKLIISGEMDHSDLLMCMEEHISKAKEEACSRKDIMEKVNKWMASCEEERWLEEYSRDENRYSVSRGAHKNLKRAERARIIVNKIPALVESLMTKTRIWEEERKKVFLYDEAPLLAMLQQYTLMRQEKEEEKYRQRERKKVQAQVAAQQDKFSSRTNTSASPLSNRSLNSSFSSYSPSYRRLSITNQHQRSKINSATQGPNFNKMGRKKQVESMLVKYNHVRKFRTETASEISTTISGPSSP